MAQINILLEKQLLTIQNMEIIASGDSNFDSCEFTFDKTWDGFVKTAVFYQEKTNVQYVVLGNDDTCMIPAAAMAKAKRMYIGVFGIKGTAVITSTLGTVDIREGAISGGNISTEPADDVFLAIIAQYQRIVEMMAQYESTAEQFNIQMAEQNRILETLNAFDVVEIRQQLDIIEERMISYTDLANEIMSREIVIRDVPVKFIDKVCRVENEVITAESLCDVYFDEFSYETAAKALILPVSFDGYIELTSSIDITEELNASILIRRN
ncbi:hypothetical protein IMSAG249_02237 [Lachnospiraceae bacterium]|nr:hypothetical protein IMSAGC009_04062 [Lachnospiraceae bacterium]GFI70408.1 hypothetical protein IMSAG249_02237 [Lachnospiraceae bacterium]